MRAPAVLLVVAVASAGLWLLLPDEQPAAAPRLPAAPAAPAAPTAPRVELRPPVAPAAPAPVAVAPATPVPTARRLSGVVRDAATGEGLAGARVAVRRREPAGDVQGCVADARGAFALDAAPAGELELMAVADGCVVADEPLRVAADAVTVVVALTREGSVTTLAQRAPAARPTACCDDEARADAPCAVAPGPFLDAAGRPFQGLLGCDPDDPALAPFEVALDAQGRPALDTLPAGRWTLHLLEPPAASGEELSAWVLEVEVAPGAPLPLTLDARGPRTKLEGLVRGVPAGAALQVDLRPATPSPAFSFLAARVADEAGRFGFPAVPPGRYLVRATWDDGAVETEVDVREGVAGWVDLTAI